MKKANKSEKKRKKSEKKGAHNFIKTGDGGGSKAIYKIYKKNRHSVTRERPLNT